MQEDGLREYDNYKLNWVWSNILCKFQDLRKYVKNIFYYIYPLL